MTTARKLRAVLSAAALAAVTLAPMAAQASPDAEEDALRISAAGHTLKWNWTPPGKSERFGHGEAVVGASYDRVRDQILGFQHYKEFNPARFKASRVVGHPDGGGSDVYMQFSALHGMVTLWTVLRFNPFHSTSDTDEVMEGNFQRGNVDDADVIWTIKKVDDNFTVVKCDILLKPDIPAPQSALDEELRDAAQQAVDGVRERAQGNKDNARWSR